MIYDKHYYNKMYDFTFITEEKIIFVVKQHRNDDVLYIVDNVLSDLFEEYSTEIYYEISEHLFDLYHVHQYYEEFVEQMKETIAGFCEVVKEQDSPDDVPNSFYNLIGHQNIIVSLQQMLTIVVDDPRFIDECLERLFYENEPGCIAFYKEHHCFGGVMNDYYYDKMRAEFNNELRIVCQDFFNGYDTHLIG